jgi:ribosome-associated protein
VSEAFEIPIRDESIRLGQLLKLASLVDDGGTAREAIESGLVRVDGEVETRRGRKVAVGSTVEFAGSSATVVAG